MSKTHAVSRSSNIATIFEFCQGFFIHAPAGRAPLLLREKRAFIFNIGKQPPIVKWALPLDILFGL